MKIQSVTAQEESIPKLHPHNVTNRDVCLFWSLLCSNRKKAHILVHLISERFQLTIFPKAGLGHNWKKTPAIYLSKQHLSWSCVGHNWPFSSVEYRIWLPWVVKGTRDSLSQIKDKKIKVSLVWVMEVIENKAAGTHVSDFTFHNN